MTIKTWALCATILTTLTGLAQTANAQNGVPTNFPPASFDGKQFVDNSGCIYVRAGFDGNVTWVPRVSRKRAPICGQTPTFGKAASVTAAAPAPRAAPVQITMAPTATTTTTRATTVATAPAAAPVRVNRTPAPVVRSAATTAPRVIVPAAPMVIKAPASKPIAAEPPRVVRRVPATSAPTAAPTVRIATSEACAAGQNYRMHKGKRIAVRCGPQDTPFVTTIRRGEAPAPGKNVYYNRNSWQDSNLSPQTRIVPRHVYESRDTQIASVPAGYRPAWEDDRLNPYRAIQTVQGHMETQQVWTNQVPRGLVSQSAKPKPFPTNLWSRKYKHQVIEPTIAYRAQDSYPPARVQADYAAQAGYRTDVLSTRTSSTGAGGGFVQIGVFSTADKANAAAALLTSAGFPVQSAKVRKGGTAMQSLRVGPYGTAVAAQAALSAVHRVGYTQAYIR